MDIFDDDEENYVDYSNLDRNTLNKNILSSLSKLLDIISLNWTIEDYANVGKRISSYVSRIKDSDTTSISKLVNYFESIYCGKVLYNNEDEILDAHIDSLLTLHLKDTHKAIYNKIVNLFKNGEVIVNNGKKINYNDTLKNFAELIAEKGYNSQFLLYLKIFTRKNKSIKKGSFIKEVSLAKKRLATKKMSEEKNSIKRKKK